MFFLTLCRMFDLPKGFVPVKIESGALTEDVLKSSKKELVIFRLPHDVGFETRTKKEIGL